MFSYYLTAKIFLNLSTYTLCSSIVLLVGCFTHILIALNFYVREVDFLRLINFHLAECIPIAFTVTYSILLILSAIIIWLKFRLTTFTYLTVNENALMRISLFAEVTLVTINIIISMFCFMVEGNLIKRTERGLCAGLEEYNNDLKSKELIDRIQIRHRCCGIVSYKDWFRYEWFRKRSEETKNVPNRPLKNEHIPFSCCSDMMFRPCTHHFLHSDKHFYDYDFVGGTLHTFWTEGCLEKISNNYLSAFHAVNFSNFVVMTLYFIQFAFDRIIQTADSTTFVKDHLQGWIFMRPAAASSFFSEKKHNLGALKRKFQAVAGNKKDSPLLQKRKKDSKTRRSVQFQDFVVSYPHSEEKNDDSPQNEENKSK